MLSRALAPLSALRQSMCTSAPMPARFLATALPIPLFAPETIAVFPRRLTSRSCFRQNSFRRTLTPSLVCVGSRKYCRAPSTDTVDLDDAIVLVVLNALSTILRLPAAGSISGDPI